MEQYVKTTRDEIQVQTDSLEGVTVDEINMRDARVECEQVLSINEDHLGTDYSALSPGQVDVYRERSNSPDSGTYEEGAFDRAFYGAGAINVEYSRKSEKDDNNPLFYLDANIRYTDENNDYLGSNRCYVSITGDEFIINHEGNSKQPKLMFNGIEVGYRYFHELHSPNGSLFQLQVGDDGTLGVIQISGPPTPPTE